MLYPVYVCNCVYRMYSMQGLKHLLDGNIYIYREREKEKDI